MPYGVTAVMTTADDIRRIALALPRAYEDTHRRAPAFRVDKRIFGMLPFDPPRLVIKLEREDQLNMVEAYPGLVTLDGRYSHHGWTAVWFEGVDPDLLETLLRLAWINVAPKTLVKESLRP